MPSKEMSRLIAFAYEADEARRGDAFGKLREIAARENENGNTEDLREILRRLLWSMNDESGGVGWFSAEAAAAIMLGAPELIDEYGILLASFMNMFPFEASVHRALARLSAKRPDVFDEITVELAKSLNHDESQVRVAAAGALASIDNNAYSEEIEKLLEDNALVTGYDYETGKVWKKTVGEVAKELLKQ